MSKVLENPTLSTFSLLEILVNNRDRWFTASEIQRSFGHELGVEKSHIRIIQIRLLKLYKWDLVSRRRTPIEIEQERGGSIAGKYKRVFRKWEWRITKKGERYFDWKLRGPEEAEEPVGPLPTGQLPTGQLPPPEEIEETEVDVKRLKKLSEKATLTPEEMRDVKHQIELTRQIAEDAQEDAEEAEAESAMLRKEMERANKIIRSQRKKIESLERKQITSKEQKLLPPIIGGLSEEEPPKQEPEIIEGFEGFEE